MSSGVARFTEVELNGSKPSPMSKERKKNRHLRIALIILVILLFAFIIAVIILAVKVSKQSSSGDVCTTAGCLATALELLNSMNTSVDPCEDFYQFSCGKWISSARMEDGVSKFEVASQRNSKKLSGSIIAAYQDPSNPEAVKKISLSYAVCGQYTKMSESDQAWLRTILQTVGGWPMMNRNWNENNYNWAINLANAIAQLTIKTPIFVSVDANIFESSQRVIHIHQQQIEALVPFNKEKILKIAKAIGNREDEDGLEQEFDEIQTLQQELATISRPEPDILLDPSDYKILTIEQLSREIPGISWLQFLKKIIQEHLTTPLKKEEPVIVLGINFLNHTLQKIFNGDIKIRTLANYIAASFVQDISSHNDEFTDEAAIINPRREKSSGRQQSADASGYAESCLQFFSAKASPAVDYIYYKSRKEKLMDSKMLDYAFDTLVEMVKESTWLDEQTKAAVVEKLQTMTRCVEFPEIATNEKKLKEYFRDLPNITHNALKNQLEIQRLQFRRQAEILRQRIDRTVWYQIEGTHWSQMNAFHGSDFNVIMIPAGIQTLPMFDADRPSFWNFGAMGLILGHEIMHGFDLVGSTRDKTGSIRDWWTPKSKAEFEKRSKCMEEQYGKFSLRHQGKYLNGAKTLSENIADNGGVREAYRAYKKWKQIHGKEKPLPGLEKYTPDQLLYLSLTQPWCSIELPQDEFYQRASDDTHSPNIYRIIGSLRNSKDFADVFRCKPGSGMNPKNKCVVW